jgi:flagellar FliL protein
MIRGLADVVSMKNTNWLGMCLVVMMALLGAMSVTAEDEEAVKGEDGVPAVANRAIYIPIKPAFVVNYGGTGRLKYLKAELSVRVASAFEGNAIRHHMPYIRNNIILLFSRQSDENLNNQEGKEILRQEALGEINKILIEQEGESGVLDLYFNQLVVQR